MDNLYEHSTYIFRAFDPKKKFDFFSYQEVDNFDEVNSSDAFKGNIFKIQEEYFIYSKEITEYCFERLGTTIMFKRGKKILFETDNTFVL